MHLENSEHKRCSLFSCARFDPLPERNQAGLCFRGRELFQRSSASSDTDLHKNAPWRKRQGCVRVRGRGAASAKSAASCLGKECGKMDKKGRQAPLNAFIPLPAYYIWPFLRGLLSGWKLYLPPTACWECLLSP